MFAELGIRQDLLRELQPIFVLFVFVTSLQESITHRENVCSRVKRREREKEREGEREIERDLANSIAAFFARDRQYRSSRDTAGRDGF